MRFLSPETTLLAIANTLVKRSWGPANDHGINHQQKGHKKFRRRKRKKLGQGGKKEPGGERGGGREAGWLVLSDHVPTPKSTL